MTWKGQIVNYQAYSAVHCPALCTYIAMQATDDHGKGGRRNDYQAAVNLDFIPLCCSREETARLQAAGLIGTVRMHPSDWCRSDSLSSRSAPVESNDSCPPDYLSSLESGEAPVTSLMHLCLPIFCFDHCWQESHELPKHPITAVTGKIRRRSSRR